MENSILLLDVLVKQFPDSSKNTLRSWVERGRIWVDGKPALSSRQQVAPEAAVTLGKKTLFIEEGIEIVYEDDHVVVINKPEGLLSVATDFQKWNTAHAILKRRFNTGRVYPVHRLDRETSGVMIFAYTEKARDRLKELFFLHTIEREYYAIVDGLIEEDQGSWKSFLAEDDFYNVSSTPHPEKGRLAITHYEVVKRKRSATALKLRLETGRKNQIRVHCKEAGYPVVGDTKYCAKADFMGRLCLHARRLALPHPITQKPLVFESPLPTSFLPFFC